MSNNHVFVHQGLRSPLSCPVMKSTTNLRGCFTSSDPPPLPCKDANPSLVDWFIPLLLRENSRTLSLMHWFHIIHQTVHHQKMSPSIYLVNNTKSILLSYESTFLHYAYHLYLIIQIVYSWRIQSLPLEIQLSLPRWGIHHDVGKLIPLKKCCTNWA